MDAHLTDLDALILKVRERRSREYIGEAVTAYRVGAYKAAVIGTWIAVTFDILMKIREIAQAGDKAAAAFTATFDTAAGNNNLPQLILLEAALLDKALDPFAFIGTQEYYQLSRLKEDRNLCAHPAFSTEAELFQASPELVRLHIVTAVEALLASTPVQGKTMLIAFDADLRSTAFPRDPEHAVRYVGDRYLARLRPGTLDNFAAVLLKGYLRGTPDSWIDHRASILHALTAIFRYRPEFWVNDLRPLAARLIGELPGDLLPHAFGLLKMFPDLRDRLDDGTRIRLRAVVENHEPGSDRHDAIFAAAGLTDLDDAVLATFLRLEDERQAQVIANYPSRLFWPQALATLRDAGSFRGAEASFQQFVTPLAGVVQAEDLAGLATAVEDNGQVWDAAQIPALLGDFVDRIPEAWRLMPHRGRR